MNRVLFLIGLMSIGVFSGGCTILKSVDGNDQSAARVGTAYSLPKAFLKVKLSDVKGELVLSVGPPVFLPDEQHMYFLQYKKSPFSSDKVELKLDSSTNLLTSVSVTADDKSGDIIVELAKAAPYLMQSGALEDENFIFESDIDPANDEEILKLNYDLNSFAVSHAKNMYTKLKCATSGSTDACDAYSKLLNGPNIKFNITKPQDSNSKAADCSIGVCYRAPAPYGIKFSFNDRYLFGTTISLPNGRHAIALPMDRTAFVKRIHSAEFEHGILKSASTEKPSEGLEIASLPVKVLSAFNDSLAKLIQLKIDTTGKEKALVEAQTEKIVADNNLQNKRLEQLQKQSAIIDGRDILIGSSSGRKLLRPLGPVQPSTSALQNQSDDIAKTGITSPSNPGQEKIK